METKLYRRIDPSPELLGMMHYREFDNGLAWKLAKLRCRPERLTERFVFSPSLRLIFTLQGISHIHYGPGEILLKRGEAVLLHHVGAALEGNKHFYAGEMQKEVVLFFDGQWLEKNGISALALRDLQASHLPLKFKLNGSMWLYLAQLLHSEENPTPWQTAVQHNLCTSLLLEVLQSVLPDLSNKEKRLNSQQERLDRLFDLLHSHEADNWTIGQMAQYCCSNPTTLQKLFRERYHTTIMQYLRQLKMQRAKQALLGGATVSAAAQLAGYRKVECFSRQFYQEFGILPSKLK